MRRKPATQQRSNERRQRQSTNRTEAVRLLQLNHGVYSVSRKAKPFKKGGNGVNRVNESSKTRYQSGREMGKGVRAGGFNEEKGKGDFRLEKVLPDHNETRPNSVNLKTKVGELL